MSDPACAEVRRRIVDPPLDERADPGELRGHLSGCDACRHAFPEIAHLLGARIERAASHRGSRAAALAAAGVLVLAAGWLLAQIRSLPAPSTRARTAPAASAPAGRPLPVRARIDQVSLLPGSGRAIRSSLVTYTVYPNHRRIR